MIGLHGQGIGSFNAPLRRATRRPRMGRLQPAGGVAARLGRIVRCVLLAAQRLTGKLDEVVGDEGNAEYGIDLSAPRRMTRCTPERLVVIGAGAKVGNDPPGNYQRA